MSKPFYGVGFNSGGKYKSKTNGKPTKSYQAWYNILERCYNPKFHLMHPTYIGCVIADEWRDYQDFAEWFEGHEYSGLGYQLDKDLLIPNNKIYSSNTCRFVPRELNTLLTDRSLNRGALPQGVTLFKESGKYLADIRINGKKKHLGLFVHLQDACDAYILAKEAYVKQKALEWRGRIDDDVFEVLMNWRFVG